MKKIRHTLLLGAILLLLMLAACLREPTETITRDIIPETGFAIPSGTHSISLAFVNAGKADCVLLLADGTLYCIDTGLDTSVEQIVYAVGCITDVPTDTIEAVFFTHGDRDHIGGYAELSQLFSIRQTYAPWYTEDPQVFTDLDPDVIFLRAGTSIPIGDDGLYLDVLAPLSRSAEENDNSLVLRLISGETTILFTGDMRTAECAELLAAYPDGLRADIWKTPYHGRENSVTKELLTAVDPRFSFVCADRTTHPDSAEESCLALLSESGEVYCTDDATLGWHVTIGADGTVTVNDLCPREPGVSLEIADIDTKKQCFTIENTGADVDLSGCIVKIEPSDALFRIPNGTVLPSDETLTIGSRADTAELLWQTEEKLLRKKKSDTVTVYDPTGALLCTAESNQK